MTVVVVAPAWKDASAVLTSNTKRQVLKFALRTSFSKMPICLTNTSVELHSRVDVGTRTVWQICFRERLSARISHETFLVLYVAGARRERGSLRFGFP